MCSRHNAGKHHLRLAYELLKNPPPPPPHKKRDNIPFISLIKRICITMITVIIMFFVFFGGGGVLKQIVVAGGEGPGVQQAL